MSRGVIVDLDGTVYHGDTLLTGAASAVEHIRSRCESLLFFSNNPIHDGSAYLDRLNGLGLSVEPGEACSAADVTVEYLQAEHATDRIFVIGAEQIGEILRKNGLTLTAEPNDADVMLAGWSPEFHYQDMVDALRVDESVPFLGTDPDRTFPSENGVQSPGSGAIIYALACVLETEPDRILGKPSPEATQAALDRLGVDAGDCLVIGDRLSTDIAMGERAGMETAVVLTGATDRSDLDTSEVRPDHVLESIADIDTIL